MNERFDKRRRSASPLRRRNSSVYRDSFMKRNSPDIALKHPGTQQSIYYILYIYIYI